MRKIEEYFKEYGKTHQTKGNKLTHFIGIPLIIVAIFGFLDRWILLDSLFAGLPLTGAMLVLVAANLFYLRLHALLGLTMVVSTFAMYWVSLHLTFHPLLALFLVGWFFQLYGHHKFEGKKPAFLDNFVHLFIGPIFIQNELFGFVKHGKIK